jgi:hypothetical protein
MNKELTASLDSIISTAEFSQQFMVFEGIFLDHVLVEVNQLSTVYGPDNFSF